MLVVRQARDTMPPVGVPSDQRAAERAARRARQRRRRRLRRVLALVGVAAVAAVVTGAVAVTREPERATARPVSLACVTTTAGDVTIRGDQMVTLEYAVGDLRGGFVRTSLKIATRSGAVLRRLTDMRWTPVGVPQVWRGRVHLPVGVYRYYACAEDADGCPQKLAQPGRLTVLPSLPPLVPQQDALRRALDWVRTRAGQNCVAVVDSRGRVHGVQLWRPVASYSVVKAMILVQYLRTHPTVDGAMQATLARMIQYSDNGATGVVYAQVGPGGLERLARVADMRGFHASGAWISTRITAGDMARFFFHLDDYVPLRHRAFARRLLSGIVSYQRWGIPAAAGPLGYRACFKGGWSQTHCPANQAGLLERGKVRLGVAVFTAGHSGGDYGHETIRGVTERLLR